MKILSILLLVLLIIIGLLGFGLQRFLTEGLTVALNEQIFPAAEAEYGLKVSVTNATVNLFKGRAELQGVTVRNLDGYQESHLLTAGQCLFEVDLLSLLKRDPIIIKRVQLTEAMLVIERNAEQDINIQELAEKLNPAGTDSGSEETALGDTPEPAVASTRSETLPVHIRRVVFDVTVLYIDNPQGLRYSMDLHISGSDLFSQPAEGQPESLLVLRGALTDDEKAFETDLNARVKPLTDFDAPSFKLSGGVLNMDPALLGDLLSKNDMESGPFSVRPSISCDQGALVSSHIELDVNDLKIYGANLGKTTLKLPLKGTLKDPSVDLTSALQTLFSNKPTNLLKLIGSQDLSKTKGKGADPKEVKELETQLDSAASNSTTSSESFNKALSDVLSEQIEKNIKSSDDQDALKQLSKSLFGE